MQSLHDAFRHVGFLSVLLAALVCSRPPRAQTKTCAETKDNPASAAATDVQPITPVLYFPRLVNTGSQLTGIAAANPGQSTARVTLTAYDDSGLLLGQKDATREQLSNPSTRLMLPRTQIAELGFQIFGDSLNTTGSWAKLISNQRGMTGFYLAFDDGLNTMDGADASGRLLREFVIEELENAEISLVNPAENRQADVALTLVDNQGQARATQTLRIPPNGRFSDRAANLFASDLVSADGYLRVSSSAELAATEMFGVDSVYAAALNPIDSARGAKVLYSPQYAAGGGVWKTTLTLINLESAQTSVSLRLLDDSGAPIGSELSITLPVKGRAVLSDPGAFGLSASGPIVQGYVRIISDKSRVDGYARFGDPDGVRFQTALPFVAVGRTDVIYSQVARNDTYFTGLATINPDPTLTADISVSVFDTGGSRVAASTLSIPPTGRSSKLLTEILPGMPQMSKGYFRVTSDRPVLSFAIFGTNALTVLSAVPPQPLPSLCQKPAKVKVLPVIFVASDQPDPTPDQKDRLMRHLQWSQTRYREMLQGRSTFDIADQVPTTYYSTKPRSYYQAQPEGAAPEFVSELLDFFNLNRFNCPYIFLVLFISPEFEFPYAGARPLNGGVNTGAGVVEISSYQMDSRPNFQSTLQHELGHSFGLPHVEVYGYDMNTNASIMSYSSAQWTNYFEPSKTPGILIPEDIRALALNKLVFDNLVFDPMWDIPSGYLMAKSVVPLGPQDIPNNPLIGATTDSGETYGSSVRNIVQHQIKPSVSGQGITWDNTNMWQSDSTETGWVSVELTFPFYVTLDQISVHSQHSGAYHPAVGVKIEVEESGGYRELMSKEPIGINEAVSFEETSAAVWRLSFKAGSSKYVVIRGLRFFLRNEEFFPPLLPYFHFDPDVANYPGVVRLSTPPSGGLPKDATSVQLHWQPTENAQEYLVQVDTVEGFCTPAFESQVDKTVTTVKIDQLDPSRLYYWRVKAINTAGTSSMGWSEIWKFKTPP